MAHGWWEDERSPEEVLALIHSEWSEALEEARAGRPLVWYYCGFLANSDICDYINDDCEIKHSTDCKGTRGKPEGIAVELIDGCIRILDYMGHTETSFTVGDEDSTIEELYNAGNVNRVPDKVSELIANLHLYTSQAMMGRSFHDLHLLDQFALMGAMAAALSWVKKQGLDPLEILLEKHEYNKGRPYKHGKKF